MNKDAILAKVRETEQNLTQLRENIRQAQIMEIKLQGRLETLQEMFRETPDEAEASAGETPNGQTEGETAERLRIVSE